MCFGPFGDLAILNGEYNFMSAITAWSHTSKFASGHRTSPREYDCMWASPKGSQTSNLM